MSGRASGRRARQVRRSHVGGPVQVPDDRAKAFRKVADGLDRHERDQEHRRTSIAIVEAVREVVNSVLLDLSAEQKRNGERAGVAYATWYLAQHGLDPKGQPIKSTVHATHGHPLRKGGQG